MNYRKFALPSYTVLTQGELYLPVRVRESFLGNQVLDKSSLES